MSFSPTGVTRHCGSCPVRCLSLWMQMSFPYFFLWMSMFCRRSQRNLQCVRWSNLVFVIQVCVSVYSSCSVLIRFTPWCIWWIRFCFLILTVQQEEEGPGPGNQSKRSNKVQRDKGEFEKTTKHLRIRKTLDARTINETQARQVRQN